MFIYTQSTCCLKNVGFLPSKFGRQDQNAWCELGVLPKMTSKIIIADETPASAPFSRIGLSGVRYLNKNLQNEASFARV